MDIGRRTERSRADLAGAPGLEVVASLLELRPGESLPAHIHHGVEVTYVVRGARIRPAGREDSTLPTGATLLNLRDVCHAGFEVVGDTPLELFVVHVVEKGRPLYDEPESTGRGAPALGHAEAMNAVGILQDAYRHMEWADALVWSAVLRHESLRADDTLGRRLHHLHLVQRAFLRIWRGEALDFAGTEGLRGEELAEWARGYHGEVAEFLAGLDDAALDRTVELPFADRVREGLPRGYSAPRLGDVVLQVVLHSAHHRGQAVARIHELGIEPPLVDYIAWVWSGRPEPAWENLAAPVAGG